MSVVDSVATTTLSCVTEQTRTPNDIPTLISRLPPEILQIIFIHYARGSHVMSVTVASWVNVSYVCRHWREVALTCPALWAHLFISSPRWTEELLERSKQAPLKLPARIRLSGLEDNHHPEWYFMRQVANHLERIETLHLHLWDGDIETKIYSWLSSSAPRLQTLGILRLTRRPCTEKFSALFGGDTPALRNLTLANCSVPWVSFKLTGLTTLVLSMVPVPHRKTIAEFLVILRSMQHLEILHLHDALHTTTASFSKSHANVDLPSLSRLSIAAAPPSIIITFLTCVNIPSKTSLKLDWNHEDRFVLDDYALLFSILRKRLGADQRLSALVFRSLVIECPKPGMTSGATITLSPLELDFSSSYQLVCPLKITIKSESSSVTVDRILTDISSFVPLMDLWGVHLVSPPSSADFWRATLGYFRGLRYMELRKCKFPKLASVLSLSDLADNVDGHADQVVLAPVLEELKFHGIQAIRGKVVGLRSLCDALATRKEVPGRFRMSTGDCGSQVDCIVGEWRGGHVHVKKTREAVML